MFETFSGYGQTSGSYVCKIQLLLSTYDWLINIHTYTVCWCEVIHFSLMGYLVTYVASFRGMVDMFSLISLF